VVIVEDRVAGGGISEGLFGNWRWQAGYEALSKEKNDGKNIKIIKPLVSGDRMSMVLYRSSPAES